jgi:tetratricopeptide (TPR) repeat protein
MKSKIHENQKNKLQSLSKKIILAALILISGLAQAQGKFEEGMGKAFSLWKEGKNKEASDMFERIAAAEKGSWLPNYYVALVNTTTSFGTKDKETVNALLTKAQNALDVELIKEPNNPEILIMQAMIYTGWVAFDPMTNGMKLSPKVMEAYDQALAIQPENPRAVFGRAEYEIGGAKFFGKDIKPMCAQIDRSIELFAKFKPETPFSPKWGLDRALEAQKACKQ